MPSPFPGMDPYLENPEIFPDFHDSFITYLRENLQPNLPPPYFAALGRRVWIAASRRSIGPDVHVSREGGQRQVTPRASSSLALAGGRVSRRVAVKVKSDEFREPFVEIYASVDGKKRLVTSIEVLSLSNKTAGEHGRELYLRKQREILGSQVHLVEIDLLRGGEHTTAVPFEAARDECGAFDYHVCVHAYNEAEVFQVYPMQLEEPLATLEIPLLPEDSPVLLDLQTVFKRCYDAGPYAREIDYGALALVPPLDPDQAAWARSLLGISN
ncbi:MAG: DUF4058 family protein [Isosphaeraceae bacterium]